MEVSIFSSYKKKVHPTQCAVKVVFIVAYDIDGVILHHALPPRQMVNPCLLLHVPAASPSSSAQEKTTTLGGTEFHHSSWQCKESHRYCCQETLTLRESRSSNKAGPHYLSMDAQWQREMTSVVSANELQCISYSCIVRSSTFTDCASAYNIATSQERTSEILNLVCLSGMWQHRPRYLCLTLSAAKTSTRFLTPSRL